MSINLFSMLPTVKKSAKYAEYCRAANEISVFDPIEAALYTKQQMSLDARENPHLL
jgi:hypothetical protein